MIQDKFNRLIFAAWGLFLFGLIGIQSCVFEPQTEAVKNRKIVVLGSSTAEGGGASSDSTSWVGLYKNFVKSKDTSFKVINLAKGGYTTFHLLPANSQIRMDRPIPDPERNVEKALEFDPVAIIINLPSNDVAANFPVSEQMRNYRNIIGVLESYKVPVWITTAQPRNLEASQKPEFLALNDSTYGLKAKNVHVIDFWEGLADQQGCIKPEFNSGDGIHMNDSGHSLLFHRVKEAGLPPAIQTVPTKQTNLADQQDPFLPDWDDRDGF